MSHLLGAQVTETFCEVVVGRLRRVHRHGGVVGSVAGRLAVHIEGPAFRCHTLLMVSNQPRELAMRRDI